MEAFIEVNGVIRSRAAQIRRANTEKGGRDLVEINE